MLLTSYFFNFTQQYFDITATAAVWGALNHWKNYYWKVKHNGIFLLILRSVKVDKTKYFSSISIYFFFGGVFGERFHIFLLLFISMEAERHKIFS